MGGEGESLEAALAYSNVVFAGNVLIWMMNALGSLIRGTGNMLVPALAVCLAVVLLIPLSPLLIFGWGPVPAFGIAGGGYAVLITSALTTVVLVWYLLAGRAIVRLRRARLQWPMFADILRVGGVGTISTLQTSLTVALTTALVGSFGGPAAVAGYGTGARLEYLLIPLVFGFGAPLVALVGTNIGAGQRERALRIALTGGALAFAVTEAIGIVAAIWPHAWLGLFGDDPHMLEAGAAYLRVVGPAYGFFGLGLSLYFASQGAGRLAWPCSAAWCGSSSRSAAPGWRSPSLVRLPGPSPRWRSASSSTGWWSPERSLRGCGSRPSARGAGGHRPAAARPGRARQPGQGQKAVHQARAARRREIALDAPAEHGADDVRTASRHRRDVEPAGRQHEEIAVPSRPQVLDGALLQHGAVRRPDVGEVLQLLAAFERHRDDPNIRHANPDRVAIRHT